MSEKEMTKAEKDEIREMVKTWREVKADLYKKGLDRLDDTANSLVKLSSVLITVGFTVIGTMVGYEILKLSYTSLWLSLFGFGCFMVSTVLGVLVIFRRPFRIGQDALPRYISAEWDRIRSTKYSYMKWAYILFGVGIVFEIIAMVSLLTLG